ncbi:MAG: PEP-CTERM sorting domain-containing protein [Armatimonadetes bacterium]|nr:PEP-CTERM sorting domain-containing protein [Armatimonadota bacterium]
MKKLAALVAFVGSVAASQAIGFSNVTIASPPLSNGSSYTTIANSISFSLPNAIVGDSLALRAGNVNIQYDYASPNAAYAVTAFVNLGTLCLGSGRVAFTEMVFELDGGGNEVGGPIGSLTHLFDASTSSVFSGQINLSKSVNNIRVKKAFTLLAPDTTAVDLAAVAIVNQSVKTVPEPATIAALGAGLAFIARKRRK